MTEIPAALIWVLSLKKMRTECVTVKYDGRVVIVFRDAGCLDHSPVGHDLLTLLKRSSHASLEPRSYTRGQDSDMMLVPAAG